MQTEVAVKVQVLVQVLEPGLEPVQGLVRVLEQVRG